MIADLKGLTENFFISPLKLGINFGKKILEFLYFWKKNYDISKVLKYWALKCIDFITE